MTRKVIHITREREIGGCTGWDHEAQKSIVIRPGRIGPESLCSTYAHPETGNEDWNKVTCKQCLKQAR